MLVARSRNFDSASAIFWEATRSRSHRPVAFSFLEQRLELDSGWTLVAARSPVNTVLDASLATGGHDIVSQGWRSPPDVAAESRIAAIGAAGIAAGC
jgi:hypothetical protein